MSKRLSNFLLWQLAYSEFFFTNTCWPDFNEKTLLEAIESFNHRDRRFGNVSQSRPLSESEQRELSREGYLYNAKTKSFIRTGFISLLMWAILSANKSVWAILIAVFVSLSIYECAKMFVPALERKCALKLL